MPLPDERPRASVANLINRFEHHNKRQSLVPSVPSGSSISLEVPKKDSNDKLESPPKTTYPPDSSLSTDDTSPSVVQDPPQDLDVPNAAQPTPATPSPPNDRAPLSKSPPLSSFRASTKSTATRSTPRSSNISSATPLKPQHTGQSTTSNSSSTRKPAVPRTAPSTPSKTSRASTSVTSPPRAKTPSRPKTPSSVSRPKTPSSLFAPTAASLAKSRNAPSQPPPSTKKSSASSAAADRLSKPTAASLSKARTSTAVSTRATSSARGATTTRDTKPKMAPTTATKSKSSPSTSPPVQQAQSLEDEVSVHQSGDLYGNGNVPHSQHEDNSDVPVEESQTVEYNRDAQTPTSLMSETPSTSTTGEEDDNGDTTPVGEHFSDIHMVPHAISLDNDKHPDIQDTSSSKSETANDLEDIVNLLESARTRPISIVSIPDEVNEIPDEE